MGANQSARKVTVVNDEATGVIKISDSVVQRLKGEIAGGQQQQQQQQPPQRPFRLHDDSGTSTPVKSVTPIRVGAGSSTLPSR